MRLLLLLAALLCGPQVSSIRLSAGILSGLRNVAALRILSGNQTGGNGSNSSNASMGPSSIEERIHGLEDAVANMPRGPTGAMGATGPGLVHIVGGAMIGTRGRAGGGGGGVCYGDGCRGWRP